MELFFPDLTKLKPTILSTVLKAIEEYGELCREVYSFNKSVSKKEDNSLKLSVNLILGELLDVAQTMFTLIYFMRKTNMISDSFLKERLYIHKRKLVRKGYMVFDKEQPKCSADFGRQENGDMFLILSRCNKIQFPNVEAGIMFTLLKLGEEIGELSQAVGKHSGLSGEVKIK